VNVVVLFQKGNEMKTLLVILGIVALAAIVFAGGMFVGTTLDIFKSMHATSFFENEATGAATTFMVVRMLDDSEVEQAKASLNLTLDTKIMTVGLLMSACDNEKSKRIANNVLARIAMHRKEHPVSSREKQVDDMIRGFLDKALQEVEEREKQNKASDATSEPAPGAASSAHQG
jgi:hypothetical protein